MYRMKIITDIGIYAVPVVTEKEDPTIDDLMGVFLETKSDLEAGCFMEGWTPEDNLVEPPGVFALGKNIQILAYHVERISEIQVAAADHRTPTVCDHLQEKLSTLEIHCTSPLLPIKKSRRTSFTATV